MFEQDLSAVRRLDLPLLGRRLGECGGGQCGFTLVDLMVVLAVVAVLASIGVPTFRRLVLSNRLTTTANAMVVTLDMARMEAIKRGGGVQFCGSDHAHDGGALDRAFAQACTENGRSQLGAVYRAVPTITPPGFTTPLVAPPITEQGHRLLNNGTMHAVRFNAQGLGSRPGVNEVQVLITVADLCFDSAHHREIQIVNGSLIHVVTPNHASLCHHA